MQKFVVKELGTGFYFHEFVPLVVNSVAHPDALGSPDRSDAKIFDSILEAKEFTSMLNSETMYKNAENGFPKWRVIVVEPTDDNRDFKEIFLWKE